MIKLSFHSKLLLVWCYNILLLLLWSDSFWPQYGATARLATSLLGNFLPYKDLWLENRRGQRWQLLFWWKITCTCNFSESNDSLLAHKKQPNKSSVSWFDVERASDCQLTKKRLLTASCLFEKWEREKSQRPNCFQRKSRPRTRTRSLCFKENLVSIELEGDLLTKWSEMCLF